MKSVRAPQAASNSHISVVNTDDIPDYPILGDERLDAHFFFTFHHNRYLNSDFRLLASPEVRAFAFDLWCLAQNQSPVGTLPDDDRILSKLLGIDLNAWLDLRLRDVGPLYQWSPCRCGDKVRLAHPVVTEFALAAVKAKKRNEANRETERHRKRLASLDRNQSIVDRGRSALPQSLFPIRSVQRAPGNNCSTIRYKRAAVSNNELFPLVDHADRLAFRTGHAARIADFDNAADADVILDSLLQISGQR